MNFWNYTLLVYLVELLLYKLVRELQSPNAILRENHISSITIIILSIFYVLIGWAQAILIFSFMF